MNISFDRSILISKLISKPIPKSLSLAAVIVALISCALATQSCTTSSHQTVEISADPPYTRVRYLDGIELEQHSKFGRAFTDWVFFCNPKFQFKELNELRQGKSYTFEITAISAKLRLELTQSLPIGVKDPLRKHEETHCAMTADVYKKGPETASAIAHSMIGQKIVVELASNENDARVQAEFQARRNFNVAYQKSVASKADELSKIFDRITHHGMNDVTNADGVKRSIDEYNKKEAEGETKHGT